MCDRATELWAEMFKGLEGVCSPPAVCCLRGSDPAEVPATWERSPLTHPVQSRNKKDGVVARIGSEGETRM